MKTIRQVLGVIIILVGPGLLIMGAMVGVIIMAIALVIYTLICGISGKL